MKILIENYDETTDHVGELTMMPETTRDQEVLRALRDAAERRNGFHLIQTGHSSAGDFVTSIRFGIAILV